MTADLIVRIGHIRNAKICVAGARTWFPRHGFDFRDFLANGISASLLLATKDPFAERAVAQAIKETADG